MIKFITMSFQHRIHEQEGKAATATDQKPSWESVHVAQAHRHAGWITHHLKNLCNKVIALLDTWDEIWVRFCAALAYVSWQFLADFCVLHIHCYPSAAGMEWPLLLQSSEAVCRMLSQRNSNPRNLGTFVCKSVQQLVQMVRLGKQHQPKTPAVLHYSNSPEATATVSGNVTTPEGVSQ